MAVRAGSVRCGPLPGPFGPGRQRDQFAGRPRTGPDLWHGSVLGDSPYDRVHSFDYRGDVTLTLKSGERIEAFIFNCQTGPTLQDSFLQCFTARSTEKRKVSYADRSEERRVGKECRS